MNMLPVVKPPPERTAEPVRVGTAGWINPPMCRASRPPERSHLEHYAAHLNCVEINSSFYGPHRPETYSRWCAATPEDFRFAVKLPRTFSHGSQLYAPPKLLRHFLDEIRGLGCKLAVLLLQLPPGRPFDLAAAEQFFSDMLRGTRCPLVCEPRHVTWFTAEARALLSAYGVGIVAADPPRSEGVQLPTGQLRYFRLHGSPRMYYSPYSPGYLAALAECLAAEAAAGGETWCIFDNTAAHAAWDDAQTLRRLLRHNDEVLVGTGMSGEHP